MTDDAHVTGLLFPFLGALDVHKTHFGGRSPTHGEDIVMTNNSYCALLPSDDVDLSLSQVGTHERGASLHRNAGKCCDLQIQEP